MKLFDNIKSFFTTVSARYNAESPAFFKKTKSLAIKLGASAIAVLTANATLSLALPIALITVLQYLVAICVGIAGTAQLTVEDKSTPSV